MKLALDKGDTITIWERLKFIGSDKNIEGWANEVNYDVYDNGKQIRAIKRPEDNEIKYYEIVYTCDIEPELGNTGGLRGLDPREFFGSLRLHVGGKREDFISFVLSGQEKVRPDISRPTNDGDVFGATIQVVDFKKGQPMFKIFEDYMGKSVGLFTIDEAVEQYKKETAPTSLDTTSTTLVDEMKEYKGKVASSELTAQAPVSEPTKKPAQNVSLKK